MHLAIAYLVSGAGLLVMSGEDYPVPTPIVLLVTGIVFITIGFLSFFVRLHLVNKMVMALRRCFDLSLVIVGFAEFIHYGGQSPSITITSLILVLAFIAMVIVAGYWIIEIVQSIRSMAALGKFLHRTIPSWIYIYLAKSWLDGLYPNPLPFEGSIFLVIAAWCFVMGYVLKDMD